MKRIKLSKISRFLLGFLGWFLYANILVVGVLQLGAGVFLQRLMSVCIWLPTVGLVIALFARKRTWLSAGIISAVAVNTAVWIFGFGSMLRFNLQYVLIPWPMAIMGMF